MRTVLLWLWRAKCWLSLAVPFINILSKFHSGVLSEFFSCYLVTWTHSKFVKDPDLVHQIQFNQKVLKMDNNRGISNWKIIGQVIGCIGISINLFFFFILVKEHSICDSLSILTCKFSALIQTNLNSIDYVRHSLGTCAVVRSRAESNTHKMISFDDFLWLIIVDQATSDQINMSFQRLVK